MTVNKLKNATSSASAGKRRKASGGVKPRPAEERGTALAIVDFFGGNLTRASRVTGIPVRTLFSWRGEQGPANADVKEARAEGRVTLLELLRNYVEALTVVALTKASTATFKEIYYAMGIMLDKIEALMKIDVVQSKVAPSAGAAPPKLTEAAQKARWAVIVQQVMADAEAEGNPMTREQAVDTLVELRPEAKEYLM